jgi:hypothetical protein
MEEAVVVEVTGDPVELVAQQRTTSGSNIKWHSN